MQKVQKTIAGKEMRLETGRIARQSNGAVLVSLGETTVLATVNAAKEPREDIDFCKPDYKKWPALQKAKGFITNLEHGNILYIPEGYWHHMKYITPGFSMSLRAIARNPKNLGKAIYNIIVMRSIDSMMRKLQGQKWIDWKNDYAIKRTLKF